MVVVEGIAADVVDGVQLLQQGSLFQLAAIRPLVIGRCRQNLDAGLAVQTRRALVRLLLIAESKRVREQVDWIPRFQQICVYAMTLPDHKDFKLQAQWRLAERALAFDGPVPRSASQWRDTLKRAR